VKLRHCTGGPSLDRACQAKVKTLAVGKTEADVRPRGGKIRDIEVLRAFAVTFTLFGHAAELLFWGSPALHWMAYSLWTGVDLFFCISGFVIARGLLKEVPSGSSWADFVSFAVPFWIKRIFRIWPSAFFWLGATLVLTLVANRSGAFGSFWTNLGDTLPAVLQVENLHYIRCLYFKIGVCSNVDGIYWSLSLEEQFYCLFPIVLFLLGRRLLIPALILGIVAQLPLARSTWDPMWGVRTDALMFGILISAIRFAPLTKLLEPTFLSGTRAISFLAVCLFLLATLSHSLAVVPFYTGLIAIVSAVMVFVASFDKGYTFPEGMVKDVLVYIGTRSYALYLAHNPMYFVTREIAFRLFPGAEFDASYTLLFVTIAAFLSLGCAEATFRLVETPLRLRGRAIAVGFLARRGEEAAPATA
jgi:peptidoglycan/LPS O-acetylase OafA/YrhL